MDNFFGGLKRHRIGRVAATYALVSWFLIQLVNNLGSILPAPDLVLKAVLLLIAVGFPITLALVWTLEPRTAENAGPTIPATVIELVLAGALVGVIALLVWQQFVPTPGDLFSRLGARNAARMGALYIVAAFALFQIVKRLADVLKWPPWTPWATLLSLVVGFPLALVLGWTLEFNAPAILGSFVPPVAIDAALAIALLSVIGFVLHEQLNPVIKAAMASQQQAGPTVSPAPSPSQPALPSTSVAVLPFRNLSRDPEQDFFSEGMTVEITSALANVPDLLVIGRVSAFKFKDHTVDLRDIGRQLGTTHLIEGSVQRDGNRVRITTELIQAARGVCIWAGKYDRELTDIFAVQEEIAHAIAKAMQVPLGLKHRTVRNSTKDLDSYESYLRAKALIRARGLGNLTEAAQLLERVVARDSNYGPAWSMLALAYGLRPNYDPAWIAGNSDALRKVVLECIPRAEEAARKAIELDPTDEYAHLSLALALGSHGRFAEAENNYRKARELDPGNPDVLHGYGGFLCDVGHLRKALKVRKQLEQLEPYVPVFIWINAVAVWLNGANRDAIKMLEDLPPDYGGRQFYLARMYASVGRYIDAIKAIERMSSALGPSQLLDDAMALLRKAPQAAESAANLPSLGSLGFIYLYVGASERYLEFFEATVRAEYVCNGIALVWHPSYAEIRKTERFKSLVRSAGFEQYWRERGAPDSESLVTVSSAAEP